MDMDGVSPGQRARPFARTHTAATNNDQGGFLSSPGREEVWRVWGASPDSVEAKAFAQDHLGPSWTLLLRTTFFPYGNGTWTIVPVGLLSPKSSQALCSEKCQPAEGDPVVQARAMSTSAPAAQVPGVVNPFTSQALIRRRRAQCVTTQANSNIVAWGHSAIA